MKTLQIIKEHQNTHKTGPNRPASDIGRFLNSVQSDNKLEWKSSKTAIIDEMDEARNYSRLLKVLL